MLCLQQLILKIKSTFLNLPGAYLKGVNFSVSSCHVTDTIRIIRKNIGNGQDVRQKPTNEYCCKNLVKFFTTSFTIFCIKNFKKTFE